MGTLTERLSRAASLLCLEIAKTVWRPGEPDPQLNPGKQLDTAALRQALQKVNTGLEQLNEAKNLPTKLPGIEDGFTVLVADDATPNSYTAITYTWSEGGDLTEETVHNDLTLDLENFGGGIGRLTSAMTAASGTTTRTFGSATFTIYKRNDSNQSESVLTSQTLRNATSYTGLNGDWIVYTVDRYGERWFAQQTGGPLFRFTLNADLSGGFATADILDMNGTDLGFDADVNDPLGIFDELVNGDPGLCVFQNGEYWVIQAPC